MKKLGTRNSTLLLMGAKTTGTFEEGYMYIEEELYIDEAETILKFCKYIDEKIGGAGRNNIEQLFEAFINPNNKKATAFANEVKNKILKYKI